jgi:WD40 repeat protein
VALADRSNWDAFLRNLDNEAAPQPNSATGMLDDITDPYAPTIIAESQHPRAARGGRTRTLITARQQAERRRLVWAALGVLAVIVLIGGVVWWQQAGRTTMVIEWPEDQRDGGRLEIDGRHVDLASTGPLEFSGRPGRRRAMLFRKGYEPVETALTFARGERRVFRPQWLPKPDTVRRQQWATLTADVTALNADLSLRKQSDPTQSDESQRKVQDLARRIEAYRERWFETEGVVEAAANLVAALPAPADALRRVDIPPEELTIAGYGEADRAPSELVAVLGSGRRRHWRQVNDVAYGPDGRTIASVSDDDTLVLWNAHTGGVLDRFDTHEPRNVAFSPDGARLAVAGPSAVELWDRPSRSRQRRFPAMPQKAMGGGVAFSPTGEALAYSNYYESTITLRNPNTGEMLATLTGHTMPIRTFAFSQDAKTLASVSYDNTARLWDMAPNTERLTLEHSALVHDVAFNADGTLLATAVDDQTRLWDVATGTERSTFGPGATAVRFSPDGHAVATANPDGIRFWEPTTGRELASIPDTELGSSVLGLAYSPDGSRLAVGCHNGTVRVWDVKTRQPLFEQPPRLTAIAVSPDGRLLAVGDETGRVILRDLATLEEVRRLDGHELAVARLAFSPDGHLLASADGHGSGREQGPVQVWEVSSGRRLSSVQLRYGAPGLAFSPDGSLLASVNYNAALGPGHLRIWKARTGEIVHAADAPTGASRVVFNRDGRTLFVSSGNTDPPLQLWDVESGREKPRSSLEVPPIPTLRRIGPLALSPDGRTLAAGQPQGGTKLWDALTGRLLRDRSGDVRSHATGSATYLSFAPDGTTLAVATEEGTVELWDLGKDGLRKTLQLGPAKGVVKQAIFTPDGRHLVTCNGNGTVYVLRLRELPAAP